MRNKPFEEMRSHAVTAAKLLKSLGNENRLMILCALMNEELSVGQLNKLIPISQSALSQHLNYLRETELVQTRRASQNIYYQLNGDETIKIIDVLKSIYCP
ncbi:MAG TPA: ArsR family transcriptional regulator [Thiotrichaceae bacterium]|jgi:DNA-binding transcriptional ArsR family regulator|nr:ArsR family transcriptional regulator [Thiotrichaceae bacterium]HIM07213.1 ArsR family transcriptional regulator [Gammaproteobacteria bacterium]